MEEETIGMVAWNRFAKLLQGPGRHWMCGDVAMHDAPCSDLHQEEHIKSSHTTLPLRLRPHQQLALSSSALPHMPICPVLSCAAPQGSLLAFAPGDVAGLADATGICSITEQPSLSP